MKTTRRSFLGMLGVGAAAAAACKLPRCSEPKVQITKLVDDPWETDPDLPLLFLETTTGTLYIHDYEDLPDLNPLGVWHPHGMKKGKIGDLVRVIDGQVTKEYSALYMGDYNDPTRTILTKISGTITMQRLDGSTFVARLL